MTPWFYLANFHTSRSMVPEVTIAIRPVPSVWVIMFRGLKFDAPPSYKSELAVVLAEKYSLW